MDQGKRNRFWTKELEEYATSNKYYKICQGTHPRPQQIFFDKDVIWYHA